MVGIIVLLCGSVRSLIAVDGRHYRVRPRIVANDQTSAEHRPTVLVTGAAGFIGSHVARHCAELGMHVVGLDDLSGGSMSNVPTGVTFVQGDVKDALMLDRLFKAHSFEYVYHLAAYAAEGLSHFIRSYNYRNNMVGSIELINQAVKHGIKCFVFTSSIAVYGAGQTPLSEDTIPQPEDPYGISKYAIELDLKAAHHMWGLNYTIFRPHNVYGPHQNVKDKYRNAIGIFMRQIINGEPMTIFGDGKQTRAFSYIDDVAPLIARSPLVSEAYNDIFNVGTDEPYTLNQLAALVAESMKAPKNIVHLDARKEVAHAHSNHSKLHRVFAPPAAVPLDRGLESMAAWMNSQGFDTFDAAEFESVEVLKNLPQSWQRENLRESYRVEH